jgi:hypothetical protein
MSDERSNQKESAYASETHGLDLTQEELEDLAEKIWELLRRELLQESARTGRLT